MGCKLRDSCPTLTDSLKYGVGQNILLRDYVPTAAERYQVIVAEAYTHKRIVICDKTQNKTRMESTLCSLHAIYQKP
jgi:hypothetical protein